MHDRFLQRGHAKLAVAELLGFLDRWIRRRLRESSDGELWIIQRDFNKRCRELATLDSPHKTPSMGALYRAWNDHPFGRYLSEEQQRRSTEMERTDPERYWGMHYYYRFDKDEAWDFIDWSWKKKCGCKNIEEQHTLKQQVELWRRDRKKFLPTLPKASLPSNQYGRPPNHQERGGRPVNIGAAPRPEAKAHEAPLPEKAGTGPGQIKEDQVPQTKEGPSEVVIGGLVYAVR